MRYSEPRPEAAMDLEVYPDYFLAKFRDAETLRMGKVEIFPGQKLDRDKLLRLLRYYRIFTFNGNNYDIPMMSFALAGATTDELKRASDGIILANVRPWEFYELHECAAPGFLDHIDLIEVAPGVSGLKMYGGRLHSRRMQDLPIDPDERVKPHQRPIIDRYCGNDLLTTLDLRNELRQQIDLRAQMSDEYGIDLRSKSDAQIAEAVLKHEVEAMTGRRVRKPDLEPPGRFYYQPPDFIEFRTENMQRVLQQVRKIPLVILRNGRVDTKNDFEKLAFSIGQSQYQMGIGGLHSKETSRSLYSDDDFVLLDRDVASYYPALIINNNLIPPALGRHFQTVYRGIRDRRIVAKHDGLKAISETLKIVLNGTFGKLGQPYSLVYAPRQMVQVTITGQLALLMAIERMEMAGISVVSANTDGFTSLVPRDKRGLFDAIMFDWEMDTDFDTEEAEYLSLHQRDINNYIAIKAEEKKECGYSVKVKGAYAASGPGLPAAMGLKKNPSADIAADAVVAYLTEGTPLEKTIRDCHDIRKFLCVRKVNGGAKVDPDTLPHLDGCGLEPEDQARHTESGEPVLLGKAIRWYYAVGVRGGIHYKLNGNTVPRSEGAMPCMQLPDEFPDDVDYGWYEREAYGILKDIGVKFVDPAFKGRTGTTLARLPDKKTVHILDLGKAAALCGVVSPGPRMRWVEYDALPDGHRLCAKCRREDAL